MSTAEVEDGAELPECRLVPQYWYPQLDTKRLALVVLAMPFGDIPDRLTSYVDAIVEISRFVAPATRSSCGRRYDGGLCLPPNP